MIAAPLVLMTEEEVAGYGRDQDAGFGALATERGLLPLTAMEVDARVVGVVASIELAQTFVNTTGAPIEATYIFPLPDRAAVTRFRMEVAGRVIEGVVEERAQAREQYDEAIAAGHRAAITEEERFGVFTLRVGNLMPREAATVRLSLVGPLPIDDGEVTFRFPLVVAPRYMPGARLGGEQAGLGVADDTALVPDASRISPPVLLPGCPNPVRLAIRVVLADRGARELASSLHSTTTETGRDGTRAIAVQPGERLDRDFILRWRVDGDALRSSLACADDADGRGGTFALTLVPPSATASGAKPRDVVFVLDRSGSMEGWKMVAARRATARMIDSLSSRDRFQVIAFDNAITLTPEPSLVAASDRARYRAVEALGKLDARGGTELAEPLRRAAAALAGGYDDRERVIVLVTDGQVGNEDHILRELVPQLRNVRVFTLGIDQAVNAGFLRRLAGAGGGLCELVESEDRLDAVMAKVHRRIGTPIATELALTPRGLDVDRATLAPRRLPDVYAGAPVVVFGRYRGRAPDGATVELDGRSVGDPLHVVIARDVEPAGAWLAASWARGHIRELEDRYAIGERELESEIVTTSKRFNVLSRFTAFLAIDRSEVANAGGKLRQIVQPVDHPAGWDMATAPSGAVLIGGLPGIPGGGAPMPSAPMPGAPVAQSRAMPMQAQATRAGMAGPASKTLAAAPRRPAPASFAPPPPPSEPRFDLLEAEEEEQRAVEPAVEPTAYLAQLDQLMRELVAAIDRADRNAARRVRERLVEWCDDVRSVGLGELADRVAALVTRLSAALAAGGDFTDEARAVATDLTALVGGAPPPTPPDAAKKKSRLAFWK